MTQTNVRIKLGYLENVKFDFSNLLQEAGEIVASEMRGNILRGVDIRGTALKPLSPAYAAWKSGRAPTGIKKVNIQAGGFRHPVGHAKPLIAQNRTLVSKSSYVVKKTGRTSAQVGYTGMHPMAKMTIGQLAYIHNKGLAPQKKREFAGITEYAKKRIVAKIADQYSRMFK